MTIQISKGHRTALAKVKKLETALKELKECERDEITRLLAQCDSLNVAVRSYEHELAELRTEVVTLDAQLATARELGGNLTVERNNLETLVEALKKTFISNVLRLEGDNKRLEQNVEHLKSLAATSHEVRMGVIKLTDQSFNELKARVKQLEDELANSRTETDAACLVLSEAQQDRLAAEERAGKAEAALKESEDAHKRHYESYTSLDHKCSEWARRATNAETRVEELEKTLSLLPGCDNPRSPQDVMDVVARLGRLDDIEVSTMYEAGRNSMRKECEALDSSVQAYSKRVALLEAEVAKRDKEYITLQEQLAKSMGDLYRAKNYSAGPSWDEHRRAMHALVEWRTRMRTILLGNGRLLEPGLLSWLEAQDEDFKQDVRRNFIQPGLKALREACSFDLLQMFKDAPSVVAASSAPSKEVKP